jgi:hypothetical protein
VIKHSVPDGEGSRVDMEWSRSCIEGPSSFDQPNHSSLGIGMSRQTFGHVGAACRYGPTIRSATTVADTFAIEFTNGLEARVDGAGPAVEHAHRLADITRLKFMSRIRPALGMTVGCAGTPSVQIHPGGDLNRRWRKNVTRSDTTMPFRRGSAD